MSAKLELLAGPAAEAQLQRDDIAVFPYVVNKAGLYTVLSVAFFFYALAAACWWQTGLSEPVWTVAFVCLLFVGTGFSAVAAYWHQFANENVVAVSSDELLVGGSKSLWIVSWELLDKKTMGFGEMELSRLRGGLTIRVAGQKIKVHLFNAVAYLSDIEGFMLGVLSHIQVPDSEDSQDSEGSEHPDAAGEASEERGEEE